jgi:hypothetical protein
MHHTHLQVQCDAIAFETVQPLAYDLRQGFVADLVFPDRNPHAGEVTGAPTQKGAASAGVLQH